MVMIPLEVNLMMMMSMKVRIWMKIRMEVEDMEEVEEEDMETMPLPCHNFHHHHHQTTHHRPNTRHPLLSMVEMKAVDCNRLVVVVEVVTAGVAFGASVFLVAISAFVLPLPSVLDTSGFVGFEA